LLKLSLTNLSYQDETWAKFPTLDVDELFCAMQLS
jgi:hypothetical protein